MLLAQLFEWIEASSLLLGAIPGLHCFRVFRSVRLPEGGLVSAVSVRHRIPTNPRAPELFVVEIWNLRRGAVDLADVKEMCLTLSTFRALYSEILEEAEVVGLRRRHRFSLHGNLIGESVESGPTVDLLSHHGGEVALWTYRVGEGRAEFDPYYGKGQRDSNPVLARMLDHLAWAAPADPVQASQDAEG